MIIDDEGEILDTQTKIAMDLNNIPIIFDEKRANYINRLPAV